MNQNYQRSRDRLHSMLEGDMPQVMIQAEARLLLEASYGGPWRMIAALIRRQIRATLGSFTFQQFEWFRTRVFRRIPDPVLEIAERVEEEDRALSRMINEL
jgi:hypothetical protein